MKKIILVPLVMLVVCSLILVGSAGPAPCKTILLKFATSFPKQAAVAPGLVWWAEEVEKQSKGRVKFDFYPGQSLFKASEMIDSVMGRVADISNMGLTSSMKRFPINQIQCLPTNNFPSTVDGLLAVREAYLKLIEKYPVIMEEFQGFKLLMWIPQPPSVIVSAKEIRVPDDLKGLKIGATGFDKEIVNYSGGAAVQVIPPRAYQAIERSVIDGIFCTYVHVKVHKLNEVCSHYLDYGFGHNITVILMNKDSWNELPADIRKIMDDNLYEATLRSIKNQFVVMDKGEEAFKASKGTIVTLTEDEKKAWRSTRQPVEDAWIANMKNLGVKGANEMLSDLKKAQAEAWK